ncbi:hypothetical protein T05_8849 [Trichinella murrelli]|uniref:Uncharacterized protein n=1 Tax=Trichinella murrelli TaxID=144512 RepID=A0A0V0TDY3_9BILA|nr:hypothetical protein T05_8849 [Trichinella murrelli]
MDRAGCNAGQANYNTTDNNHQAKRDSPSFCAPWQLEEDLLPTVYNCATLAATMTGSESKKLMTIGQMISKQAIVKSWNQMPRRWDEKSLTGRNVDDLVSSYLVVWSHLALPCAHGMKNEQKRRASSPLAVNEQAANQANQAHMGSKRKASMTNHFASRQNIKLKACRIDGCFLRQQERVSPCRTDRGRCRIFFVV